MLIHFWTPNGRRAQDVSQTSYHLEVVNQLQAFVRETGYHVVRLMASGQPQDESWSRSCCLYAQACDALRKFAGEEYAEKYINSTYKPSVPANTLFVTGFAPPKTTYEKCPSCGGGACHTVCEVCRHTGSVPVR